MAYARYRLSHDGPYTTVQALSPYTLDEADGCETFATWSAAKAAAVSYLDDMARLYASAVRDMRALRKVDAG